MHFPSRPIRLLSATTALALAGTAATSAAIVNASGAEPDHGITTSIVRPPASPGAQSAGDRLFPVLGKGGYDVRDYDLALTYRPNRTTMPAAVTVHAVASQYLSEFSLDSIGQEIQQVRLDGRQAPFWLDAKREKLIVTAQVRDHHRFTVRIDYVADRSKNPAPPESKVPGGAYPLQSWANTDDGFAVMGQPNRSHLFFPSNDHPSDKARFTVRITAPDDRTAVAGGHLLAKYRHDGATTWVYRTADPIPTHALQIAVGKFRRLEQTGPHGLPVRSYLTLLKTPDGLDLAALMERNAREIPGQLAWLEQQLGRRFPFERYGVLGLGSDYNGVALETATLSTFGAALTLPPKNQAPILVHELTHQYFGDAASVHSWDDMWISEGHARYYQARYAADRGFINLDTELKALYENDQELRSGAGPMGRLKHPLSVLLSTDNPGALMLAGLRTRVGDHTFRRIEQTFYDRFRGRSATTADYITVANRVSGRDLTPYFNAWLYSTTTPRMPGHPDWHSSS